MALSRDGSPLPTNGKQPLVRRHLRAAGVLALTAIVSAGLAACGSSSSSSTPAASTTSSSAAGGATTTSGAPAAAQLAYDGPEKGLPASFPTPAKTHVGTCTIGYQNAYAAIPALTVQQHGAQAEATKLGCSLIALDDQITPTTQVNNFNQLVSQHVNAIVVFPLVPQALGPEVAKAAAGGISIVANSTPAAANTPLPKGYSVRVLQGFDTVAYFRAKYIASLHPGANVVVIGLAQPVSSLQYFSQRAAYWSKRFGLHVLGEVDAQQDNPASASTAMSQVLSQYPTVQAIFAYNDNTAVAAGLIAKSSGKHVLICGNNGQANVFKAIEAGEVTCTALLDAYGMGEQEALGAYDLITKQGGKLPQSVLAKQTLVTAANVRSFKPVG
jgi:ribose transport system substrate-binding protein